MIQTHKLQFLALSLVVAALASSAAMAQGPEASVLQQTESVVEPVSELVPTNAVSLMSEEFGELETLAPCCDSGDCMPCGNICNSACWDPCSQWFAVGWLEQGFTGNPNADGSLLGPTGTNGPLIFNDQANEYMLNQLYLSFGRSVRQDPSCWDIGGRVDVLYGTDYYFVQSTGLETHDNNAQKWNSGTGPRNAGHAGLYGLALPQFYVEANVPWGNGLNIKAGHFYSLMGYESVMAPENFFYSHSYMMQYGEPFTHTGILASYPSSSCMTWYSGICRGWNTFDQPNGQVGYLGGFRWVSPNDATRLNFIIYTGAEDPSGNNNRTTYGLTFQQRLSQRWTYVLHHNLGTQQNARVTTSNTLAAASWFGLTNYLYYSVDPTLDLGLRFEWFDDRDNFRVFGLANDNVTSGGTYFDVTLGANYHPEDWFIVRPEVRWDWSDLSAPGINGAYDSGTAKNQFTIGFDMILLY